MRSEQRQFENRDGLTLRANIDWPTGPHQAVALFAHCFTCSRKFRATRTISEALAKAGFVVCRFDFTGLGDSDGEFSETTFGSNVTDIVDAAHWLTTLGLPPSVLIGHSLGGTATVLASQHIESAVAVATIGSPATASHVAHLFDESAEEIASSGQAEVTLAGRSFTIRKAFVDDLEQHPLHDALHALRKALLILHSPVDEVVEIDNAQQLFVQALHPKSFVSLDKANHMLSDPRDAAYAGQMLATWASRFLPEIEISDQGISATTWAGSFTTAIESGRHRLIADEPASVGGADQGPTPVQLLSISLASCTSMTLQMYARHKDIPAERVRVGIEQSSERIDGETHTTFVRTITIDGDIDDSVRERMMEIADRCPVHRALHGTVTVVNSAG
ncbi:MAG: bifunctional alpha/beta hydrolase/OsmC family protein [Pseudomonadota bacterium]